MDHLMDPMAVPIPNSSLFWYWCTVSQEPLARSSHGVPATLWFHGGPVIRGVTAMGNGMKSLMTMITIHRSSIQKCVYLLFSQLFVLISYMYFYRLDSWLCSYLTGRHNCLRSPRWTTVDGVFFVSHGFPVNSKDCFWKRERLFWQFSGSSPLLAARYHSVFLYSSLGLHLLVAVL